LLGRSREIASIAAAPANLGPAVIKAKLKDQLVDVLIDTGASDNLINKRVADELQIEGRGSAFEEKTVYLLVCHTNDLVVLRSCAS